MLPNINNQHNKSQIWRRSWKSSDGCFMAWRRELAEYNIQTKWSTIVSDFYETTGKARSIGDVVVLDAELYSPGGISSHGIIDPNRVWFMLVTEGTASYQNPTTRQTFEAGEFVLSTGGGKTSFALSGRFHAKFVITSVSTFNFLCCAGQPMAGKGFGDKGAGKILTDHVNSVFSQLDHLDETTFETILFSTLKLMKCALNFEGKSFSTETGKITLPYVKQYISENIKNSELSPSMIAEHLDVSSRYLHILFEKEIVSISEWIRRTRLECCKNALTSQFWKHQSITDVAYEWGFNDGGHFSRLFKAYTGYTPSDYRRVHLKNPD